MSEWIYMVEVPGDPIGKGRPRGTSVGGHVRLYTPKKTAEWERSAAMVMTSVWRKAPLDEPVEVEVVAFSHRPTHLLRQTDTQSAISTGYQPHPENIRTVTHTAMALAR